MEIEKHGGNHGMCLEAGVDVLATGEDGAVEAVGATTAKPSEVD